MTIPRDRFREGLTWDEWLEMLEAGGPIWRERFDRARLGSLRADYQDVITPRYVACIVDPESPEALESVPCIARACDEAGVAGGVELRLLPKAANEDLLAAYRRDGDGSTPICAVYDADWVQVGVWGPRPRGARELLDRLAAAEPGDAAQALAQWYARDRGRSILSEFLQTLRGRPVPPWRARRETSEHLRKQARHARETGAG